MGVYISKMITPVKNYFSDFWMAIFGFGPRMQGMIEQPTKAAEPPTEVAAERPTEVAEQPVKAAEQPVKAAERPTEVADEMKCPHCRGSGIKKPPTGEASTTKPQKKAVPHKKPQAPAGYAGKPEFYIEGYDKMTPDQKRAAKQAKWNAVQAARAAKGQKPLDAAGTGFEECAVVANWGDSVHNGE